MGQSDIIELLEKADRPLSRSEIAQRLNSEPYKISVLLGRLIKWGEVLFDEIDKDIARQNYDPNIKRRMRLYKLPGSTFPSNKFPNKKGNAKANKKY